MIAVKETADGVTFAVKAVAGARRNGVVGSHGQALKIAVSAPRDRGKANDALIDVIAEALGVPRKTVTLVKGETSTEKRFLVMGLNAAELQNRLTKLAGKP